MYRSTWRGGLLVFLASLAIGCGRNLPSDEALERVRKMGGEFADLGPESAPERWQKAAETYYRPAHLDYFEDMDAYGKTDQPGPNKLPLDPEQVIGRNAWVIWTGGNEAFWDWVARYGYGSIDLLKLIDDRNRETRFARTGLNNEPGTRPPLESETRDAHGVRYARPITEPAPGVEVHVEYRKDRGSNWEPPPYEEYGYPSGVVGLRLFKNPEFTPEAEKRWDSDLYYADTPEGRRYAARPDTIRPFRVGMSCGFCHIAPHPLRPPADPEFPKWENLSNNVGNQFMRMRAVFGNTLRPDNYLYHVFDAMLPGAVDTSGYPSDNDNNPNTINSFYGLRGRLDRASVTPRELIGRDSINYIRKYVDPKNPNPDHVPRVLLDGSDSVGVHIALARVYLNIGTYHQQWIRTINPLLGFARQSPFKLEDVATHSLYWHAIRIRVAPMAEFFVASTDPMRLKDIRLPGPDGDARDRAQRELLGKHLRGTGLPWYTEAPAAKATASTTAAATAAAKAGPPKIGGAGDYAVGRRVFARGCIACHSSVQPGDLLALEQKLTPGQGSRLPPLGQVPPADWKGTLSEWNAVLDQALGGRRSLRLTVSDRIRLSRGDGQLPPAYAEWAREAVQHREFWEYQARAWDAEGNPVLDSNGRQQLVTTQNYLSIDERLPMTIPRTNPGRATATNALSGHVWEDFAAQTYKELEAIGPLHYHDPFSGSVKAFSPPGGGPGYYRVPTLISIWATSPLFHNNALGRFNNDPSVPGRLAAFEDAIGRLLWPDRRQEPSEQVYWPGEGAATTHFDAWYPGKDASKPVQSPEPPTTEARGRAAEQRALDYGWIWRTTEESWLMFDAPHIPSLVGGVAGLSREQTILVAWVPSLVFLLLGLVLLLASREIPFIQRLMRHFAWLEWLIGPIRWSFAAGGLFLAGYSIYLVTVKYRPVVELVDMATARGIPGLRIQAVAFPVVLFGSIALLAFRNRLPDGRFRSFVFRWAGAACLILAVVAAYGVGRTLSGQGQDFRIGPIPEGIPVNILANLDPESPDQARTAAVEALVTFLNKNNDAALADHSETGRAARRRDFEEQVAPALLKASKCPDFVTDHGHDYVFIRDLTDEEKQELIALLKTF